MEWTPVYIDLSLWLVSYCCNSILIVYAAGDRDLLCPTHSLLLLMQQHKLYKIYFLIEQTEQCIIFKLTSI
jgi:hypothetical protein